MDYKVDAKKLKEVFKLAGRIYALDLSLDKEGNSRGFAVIEYDHPVEAVQAISMFDRQMLFDRRMTVRLDRIPDKGENVKLPEGLRGIGIGLGPNGEPLKNVANNLPSLQQNQNNSQNVSSLMDNNPVGALAQIGNALPANSNLTSQLAALNNVFGNLSGGSLPNSLLSTAANLNNLGLNLGGGVGVGVNNDLPAANPNSVGYQSAGGNFNSGFGSGNLGSARSDFDNLGGNTGSVRNYNTRPQDDFVRGGGGGNIGNIGGFMNNGNNGVSQQRTSDTIIIKNVSNKINLI